MFELLLGAGALLLLANKGTGSAPVKAPPSLKLLQAQAARAGVSPSWVIFLGAVAHHESRWVNTANNKSAGEVSASAAAYDRNAETLSRCDIPRARYVIGSGGWFGFLPANGIVAAFRGTSAVCVDPETIFDPWISTLMAIGYAKNLTAFGSFRRSDGSWLALNRGWAVPGKMDIERPETDARFLKGLRAQGIPESFARQPVADLPNGWNAFAKLQLEVVSV